VISTEDLLHKLIDIDSTSGNEAQLVRYISSIMRVAGFNIELIPTEVQSQVLIARMGNPKIYLSAHCDTVAPYIPFSENKTHIFGRGACDTKGALAAMITVCLQLHELKATDFGLIVTVDEEKDFKGAQAILDSKMPIPFVVVGEPTDLGVVNGHYGYQGFEFTAKGKSAHTSIPEKGINAIELLMPTLDQIIKFKPKDNSVGALVKIDGGKALNVVPDCASFIYTIRQSPQDTTNYARELKKLCTKRVTVHSLVGFNPIISKVPRSLSFLPEPKTVKYCTELTYLKKGIVLGPGSINDAHSDKEFVLKSELTQAVEIYRQIIRAFIDKG